MPATKSTLEYVGVRIDKTIIVRVDALVPLFSSKARDATRSDMLRILILAGLARFERDPEGTKNEVMALVQPAREAAAICGAPLKDS